MGDGPGLSPFIPRMNVGVALADGAKGIPGNAEIIRDLLLAQERRQRLDLLSQRIGEGDRDCKRIAAPVRNLSADDLPCWPRVCRIMTLRRFT